MPCVDSQPGQEDEDAHMARYYADRAASYERIYHKPERQQDLRRIERDLPAHFDGRHVLEIACGTGWWTVHGARDCASWLACDLNEKTLRLARLKPCSPGKVRFRIADAYALESLGRGRFDAAFAGCWWSHVPHARLGGWLEQLHDVLGSGARVVMLDNRFVPGSSTPISRRDDAGNTYQRRTLDDGSTYEIVKNFPTAEEAIAALGPRARDARWIDYDHYWLLRYELA